MGPLVPLFALFWLAPPPAAAQGSLDPKAAAAVYEQRLAKDLNPFTADSFLRDQPVLDYLRATDPERQARLLTQATQLKDLMDMLTAHAGAGSLVDSLAIRLKDPAEGQDPPYFGFAADPALFVKWNARWHVLANNDVLRKALLEWDTLNPKPRDYLVGEKITEAAWQRTSYANRLATLRRWADMVYKNILALNPRSKADFDKMHEAAGEIAPLLAPADKREMWSRVDMAFQSANGLAELDKHAAQLNSPELQALAQQARNGASVEDTLTALSRLFDRLGIQNRALHSLRPTTASDKLSDSDRGVLQGLLSASLMEQTKGTDAGKELEAFFKNHARTITILDLPSGDLAQYRHGPKDIVFNEKFIMDWAKGEGLKGRDLVAPGGAAALERLSILLSPNFVHEARHQQQQAWAEENGYDFLPAQNAEVEAKGVEALFFLQKAGQTPAAGKQSFAKVFADSRDSSMLANEEIHLAAHLRQGAPFFRNRVMSDYYEGLPSLEAMTAAEMKGWDADLTFLRGELARRKALPQSEQDAIESGGQVFAKDQKFKDAKQWRDFCLTAKTSALEKKLKDALAGRDTLMQSYRGHAKRADDFQDWLDDGLKRLGTGASKSEPPVPAADK
ncbi:MAG: hypothetical protein HY077_09450 [Elusimicrobia bacterium]|nr:hypothetical protein [Elusimicrobiota bacterium]